MAGITGSNIGRTHRFLQAPNRITILRKGDVALRSGGPTTRAADCAEPSQALLIDLGITWQDSDIPDALLRRVPIIADVKWGVGAASFNAQVDWKMGTQLCLSASFLEVDAFYEETGTEIWNAVSLSAGLAYGSSPARAEPTRTYSPFTLAQYSPDLPATTVIQAIPPFAHSVIPFLNLGDASAGPDVQLTFLGGPLATDQIYATGNIGPSWSGAYANGEGIRIPGPAKFVMWRNMNAVSIAITTMFGLQL